MRWSRGCIHLSAGVVATRHDTTHLQASHALGSITEAATGVNHQQCTDQVAPVWRPLLNVAVELHVRTTGAFIPASQYAPNSTNVSVKQVFQLHHTTVA